MGDSNVPSTHHSAVPNNAMHSASTAPGMDALISAIEYQRKLGDPKRGGLDPKLMDSASMLYGGYSLMANVQDHKNIAASMQQNAENQLRAHSLSQASKTPGFSAHLPFPSANMLPAVTPGALGSTSSLGPMGIHPMFMPFMPQVMPGLRPNGSNQVAGGLPLGAFPHPNAASQWGVRASSSEQMHESKDPSSVYNCSFCAMAYGNATELHIHVVQKHLNPSVPVGNPPGSHMTEKKNKASSETGERSDMRRSDASHEAMKMDMVNKNSDINASYPSRSGVHPTGLTAEKLASMQEAAAKNLQFRGPGVMDPYLGLQTYQSLLAANASRMLPSMLPSTWNPGMASLGLPYYQGGMMPRLPYLPPMAQGSMIRMPSLNTSVANPPAPSITPDSVPTSAANIPSPVSRLGPSRPQSGGYLPIKENLQRRLSAPIMVSGSSTRLPPGRGIDMGKANPNYPGFPHGTYPQSRLPGQTSEASKTSTSGGKSHIDHKSIEDHISKLISHNEKILLNPTLDRVKPRRVFRRSSLDPSSLSSNHPHNPLTATYSAPRCLDTAYQKSEEKSSERQNFLTVPSRLTDPNIPFNGGGISSVQSGKNPPYTKITRVPDARYGPSLHRLSEAEMQDYKKMIELYRAPSGESSALHPSYDTINERAKAVTQGLYQQAALGKRLSTGSIQEDTTKRLKENTFQCADCEIQFLREENYITHQKMYCLKRSSELTSGGMQRQSVIQHTGGQPGDSQDSNNPALPKSVIPQVNVTPPSESTSANVSKITSEMPKTKLISPDLLTNPLKAGHKELCRTRSADAALQISKIRVEGLGGNTQKSEISAQEQRLKLPPPSPKSDTDSLLKPEPSVCSVMVTKSSIPTDKLPPKKKQLQLMRSNSSNQSYLDSSKSPSHSNPSPQTPDNSPKSQGRKTPENSAFLSAASSKEGTDTSPLPAPFISTPSPSAASRKSLPPWIPLDQDEDASVAAPRMSVSPSSLAPAPTILLPQNPVSTEAPNLPSSYTQPVKSPTSPRASRSPTRRSSPGRSPTRSPSKSPTSLETTIPRSNYKLLLHQISLRNMQDMGYLSEAYHNSKDKNLKRNIASLLWSSENQHHLHSGITSPKRSRQYSSESKVDELFPSKAPLARRLSPNLEASKLSLPYESHLGGEYSRMPRLPLSQSLSRPYESTSDMYRSTSVTRSHSTGNSTDVNNNIKQFLQNKNKHQQAVAQASSSEQPSKGHKPLRRLNANARYLLKSPTSNSTPELSESAVAGGPDRLVGQDGRTPATRALSSSWKGGLESKDPMALKRAKSYNPDSTVDYQTKRQRLIPISHPTTQASPTPVLPTSAVTLHLTDHPPHLPSLPKELPHKVNETETVTASTLLYPHLTPKMGYEPHPTFCSLLSPQPMYVELKQSVLSMYSQWAVNEPLLLPEGLTVTDLLNNLRTMKGLSPYISYGSLFISATSKDDLLKVTDTKEYEALSKKLPKNPSGKEKKSDSDQTVQKSTPLDGAGEPSVVHSKEGGTVTSTDGDTKEIREWIMSRVITSKLTTVKSCYTSCHDRNLLKPKENNAMKETKEKISKVSSDSKSNEEKPPTSTSKQKTFTPKMPLPKVIIHPPSPEPPHSPDSDDNPPTPDSKNQDITTLEFSDCDTDDTLTEKLTPSNHFLTFKKGASPSPQTTPSSDLPICPFITSSAKDTPCTSSCQISEQNEEKALPVNENEIKTAESEKMGEHTVEKTENSSKESSKLEENFVKSEKLNHDSGNSLEDGMKGQSSGSEKDESSRKKGKKVRKSRRERNAMSPRLQKRTTQQFPDSPPCHGFEDPSLAVHPTGACRGLSDDPTRTCALCSMKAGGPSHCSSSAQNGNSNSDDSKSKTDSDPASEDRNVSSVPDESSCKHAPATSHTEVPTSPARPRTPGPLTVSVPMRNRDRSSAKTANQPLTPGILDKARGKGTTQHWVTTSDLRASSPSPVSSTPEVQKNEESPETSKIQEIEKVVSKISYDKVFHNSEFNSMPPNQNPVRNLNLPKNNEPAQVQPVVSTGGQQALAAVVSGVIRSAAIQSKKKTKCAKHGMNELLSHSRPLIPTSELNGSAASSHARLSEKLNEKKEVAGHQRNGLNDKNSPSVTHVAMTTSTTSSGVVTSTGHNKYSKVSTRHLALSSRESELFLNKTNETKILVSDPVKKGAQNSEESSKADTEEDSPSKLEHSTPSSGDFVDEAHDMDEHSDDAKDDSMHEGENESSNPRPHKCLECKVAFRIAGHLAKHLRSKGHIIAMQKKTLNRLKQQQQKLSCVQETVTNGGQGVTSSTSVTSTSMSGEVAQQQALYSQLETGKYSNQEEILNQLVEGAETLARAQVRALFEGNDEYAEIVTPVTSGASVGASSEIGASDMGEDSEHFTHMSSASQLSGGQDPRPFKCIACKVAFRFQGHLDRHFRSNMHLLAVGHFEKDKLTSVGQTFNPHFSHGESPMQIDPHHQAMGENPLAHEEDHPSLRLGEGEVISHNDISSACSEPNENMENGRFWAREDKNFHTVSMTTQKPADQFDMQEEFHSPMNESDGNTHPQDLSNDPSLGVVSSTSGPQELNLTPSAISPSSPKSESNQSQGEVDLKYTNTESDSLKEKSVILNSTPKEPVNGIAPHVLNSVSSVIGSPESNGMKTSGSLFSIGQDIAKAPPTSDFKMLKQRNSPVVQSNSKPVFEAPPSLPDGPIPSKSPVHNRQQQLTC